MPRIYLGVGSNLDPAANIQTAIDMLGERYAPLKISTLYASAAIGMQAESFLNLVIGFNTDLDVDRLCEQLREIEAACGRSHGGADQNMVSMDLDLLIYGDAVINDKAMHIPRRDITEYAHVLRPLAEIAPQGIHPVLGQSFAELWAAFDQSSVALEAVTASWSRPSKRDVSELL